MKVTDVRIEAYAWPMRRPLHNSTVSFTRGLLTLVKIETDEGVTGIGPSYCKPVIHAAIEAMRPLLIGQDPVNVERLWQAMWVPKVVGRRGLTTQAISAIDIALWDLRGKIAGLPLHKLLGGYRDRVPAYIAGGYYASDKSTKDLQSEMASYVEQGVKAVKMKIGGMTQAEDAARVKAVRAAIGPDTRLLLDANCAYRAFEAITFARRVEEHDIYWFEEPVGADDYAGFRRLSQTSPIPIAAGENEYTKYGFRDLIAAGGVAILNPDAKIAGGITEFMKIAALAQAHDLAISPHGSQEVHTPLAAACPNAVMAEYYPPEFDAMWGKRYHHTIVLNSDGTVSPPDLPGLGAEPNDATLGEFRVRPDTLER
jgi:L-alanine-DL-glutamate epimerase-like enolase superfamily enzyme